MNIQKFTGSTMLYSTQSMTLHGSADRLERVRTVKEIETKAGSVNRISAFFVDKGHKNGPEVHIIRDDAVVEIYNAESKRFITYLIARPGQIRRYYEALGEMAPERVVSLARKHQLAGLNHK